MASCCVRRDLHWILGKIPPPELSSIGAVHGRGEVTIPRGIKRLTNVVPGDTV